MLSGLHACAYPSVRNNRKGPYTSGVDDSAVPSKSVPTSGYEIMCARRDVTLLYTWIDPRSEEFAIDISKGRSPTGHVTSTLPPVAPRTVVRRCAPLTARQM